MNRQLFTLSYALSLRCHQAFRTTQRSAQSSSFLIVINQLAYHTEQSQSSLRIPEISNLAQSTVPTLCSLNSYPNSTEGLQKFLYQVAQVSTSEKKPSNSNSLCCSSHGPREKEKAHPASCKLLDPTPVGPSPSEKAVGITCGTKYERTRHYDLLQTLLLRHRQHEEAKRKQRKNALHRKTKASALPFSSQAVAQTDCTSEERSEVIPTHNVYSGSDNKMFQRTSGAQQSATRSQHAFQIFYHSVSQEGVVPSTRSFNLLILLAIQERNWKLVDQIEFVYVGLLGAISDRLEMIEAGALSSSRKESVSATHCPVTSQNVSESLLPMHQRHREQDQQLSHSHPCVGSASSPALSTKATRFSLLSMEETMRPNTLTFELLMEAQLERARTYTGAPSSVFAVRQGAAWVVLELLDEVREKGITLTEGIVSHCMEAYSILMEVVNDVGTSGPTKSEGTGVGLSAASSVPTGSAKVSSYIPTALKLTLRDAKQFYEPPSAAKGASSTIDSPQAVMRLEAAREGMVLPETPSTSETSSIHPLGPKHYGSMSLRSYWRLEKSGEGKSETQLPQGMRSLSRNVSSGEQETTVWEAAFTLCSSFYTHPRSSHPSPAEALQLRERKKTIIPPCNNPFDYYYSFPLQEDLAPPLFRDKLHFPSAFTSSVMLPSLTFSAQPGTLAGLPLSLQIIYRLVLLLRKAEQHSLVVQEYEAFEDRLACSPFNFLDDRRELFWWWKSAIRRSQSRADNENKALLSWEMMGVYPSKREPRSGIRSSTGSFLSDYHHLGWELWLLVSDSARICGAWKTAFRIWEASYTAAIIAAAAHEARSGEMVLAGYSNPLNRGEETCSPLDNRVASLVIHEQQFDLVSHTVPEGTMPLSRTVGYGEGERGESLLRLRAVPRWMRQMLPLILQHTLHALRRVGRHDDVLTLYKRLVDEQKAQWTLPVKNLGIMHEEGWFWTPYALELVAQSSFATGQLTVLTALCCSSNPQKVQDIQEWQQESYCRDKRVKAWWKEEVHNGFPPLSSFQFGPRASRIFVSFFPNSPSAAPLVQEVPTSVFDLALRVIQLDRRKVANISSKFGSGPKGDELPHSLISFVIYRAFLSQVLHMKETHTLLSETNRNLELPFPSSESFSPLHGKLIEVYYSMLSAVFISNTEPLEVKAKKLYDLLLPLEQLMKDVQKPDALSIVLQSDILYRMRSFCVGLLPPSATSEEQVKKAFLFGLQIDKICVSMLKQLVDHIPPIAVETSGDANSCTHASVAFDSTIMTGLAVSLSSCALLLCSKWDSSQLPSYPILVEALLQRAEMHHDIISSSELAEIRIDEQRAHVMSLSLVHQHLMQVDQKEGRISEKIASLPSIELPHLSSYSKFSALIREFFSASGTSSMTHGERVAASAAAELLHQLIFLPNVIEKGQQKDQQNHPHCNPDKTNTTPVHEIMPSSPFKPLFAALKVLSVQHSYSTAVNHTHDTSRLGMLYRVIINALLEVVSFKYAQCNRFLGECLQLLEKFLPPPPCGLLFSERRFLCPPSLLGCYADAETFRILRRLVRFCNASQTTFVERLFSHWMMPQVLHDTSASIDCEVREQNIEQPTGSISEVDEATVDLALEIVVWSSRHRVKPLLLSCCSRWFACCTPFYLGKALPSVIRQSALSTTVVAAQALSSGPHLEVLHAWPFLYALLHEGVFKFIKWKMEEDDSHFASLLDLIDNTVAILSKLRRTFHSLIVQASLDKYRLYHQSDPERGESENRGSEEKKKVASSCSRNTLSKLAENLKVPVTEFLFLCDAFVQKLYQIIHSGANKGKSPLGRPSSELKIMSALLENQWDVYYASFVHDNIFLSFYSSKPSHTRLFVEGLSLSGLRHLLEVEIVTLRYSDGDQRRQFISRYCSHLKRWCLLVAIRRSQNRLSLPTIIATDIAGVSELSCTSQARYLAGRGKYSRKKSTYRGSIEYGQALPSPLSLFIRVVDWYTQELLKTANLSSLGGQSHTISTLKGNESLLQQSRGDSLPVLPGTGGKHPIDCFSDPETVMKFFFFGSSITTEHSGGAAGRLAMLSLQEAASRVLYLAIAENELNVSLIGRKSSYESYFQPLILIPLSLLKRMLAWPCPPIMFPQLFDVVWQLVSSNGSPSSTSCDETAASLLVTILEESKKLSLLYSLVNWNIDTSLYVKLAQAEQRGKELITFPIHNVLQIWSCALPEAVVASTHAKDKRTTSWSLASVLSRERAMKVIREEKMIQKLFSTLSTLYLSYNHLPISTQLKSKSDSALVCTRSRTTALLFQLLAAFPAVTGKPLREAAFLSSQNRLSLRLQRSITSFFREVIYYALPLLMKQNIELGADSVGFTYNVEPHYRPPSSLIRNAVSWLMMFEGRLFPNPLLSYGVTGTDFWRELEDRKVVFAEVVNEDEYRFFALLSSYNAGDEGDKQEAFTAVRNSLEKLLNYSSKGRAPGLSFPILTDTQVLMSHILAVPGTLTRSTAREVLRRRLSSGSASLGVFSPYLVEKLLSVAAFPPMEEQSWKNVNEARWKNYLNQFETSRGVLDEKKKAQQHSKISLLQTRVQLLEKIAIRAIEAEGLFLSVENGDAERVMKAVQELPRHISSLFLSALPSKSTEIPSWSCIFFHLQQNVVPQLIEPHGLDDTKLKELKLSEQVLQILYRVLILSLEYLLFSSPYKTSREHRERNITLGLEAITASTRQTLSMVGSILLLVEACDSRKSLVASFLGEHLIPWLSSVGGTVPQRQNFFFCLATTLIVPLRIFEWQKLYRKSARLERMDMQKYFSMQCFDSVLGVLLRSLCMRGYELEVAQNGQEPLVELKPMSLYWKAMRDLFRCFVRINLPLCLAVRKNSDGEVISAVSAHIDSLRNCLQIGVLLGMWRDIWDIVMNLPKEEIAYLNKENPSLFFSICFAVTLIQTATNSCYFQDCLRIEKFERQGAKIMFRLQRVKAGLTVAVQHVSREYPLGLTRGEMMFRPLTPTLAYLLRLYKSQPLLVAMREVMNLDEAKDVHMYRRNADSSIKLFDGLVAPKYHRAYNELIHQKLHCTTTPATLSEDCEEKEEENNRVKMALERIYAATPTEIRLLQKHESTKNEDAVTNSALSKSDIVQSWKVFYPKVHEVEPQKLLSLLLHLADSPSPLPQTPHFIPPAWSTAAVSVCPTWKEAYELLRASQSSLRRGKGCATAVQHLLMQCMLKRLRVEVSFRKGLSSFVLWSTSIDQLVNKCEMKHGDDKNSTIAGVRYIACLGSSALERVPNPMKREACRLQGSAALAAYCYECCLGKPDIAVTTIPRIPQRLVVDLMRHATQHPVLCTAFYTVFLQQQYSRLEGVHPFLSLLRAAKMCAVLQGAETKESTYQRAFSDALFLLVLAMDGYYYCLTGSSLLPSILCRVADKEESGIAKDWCRKLSNFIPVTQPSLATRLPNKSFGGHKSETNHNICLINVGHLPLFSGVSSISTNGRTTMWRSFSDVCQFLLSKIGEKPYWKMTNGTNPSEEAVKMIASLILSSFQKAALLSDVEELMIKVLL